MSPWVMLGTLQPKRFPRSRGDEPWEEIEPAPELRFSPLTRG